MLIVVALLGSFPANAQESVQWATCTNVGRRVSLDHQIVSCTAIIQSGKENGKQLSKALMLRGIAYATVALESKNKDGLNLSVADLTEAIRLDPTNPEAFYSRGLTHQHMKAFDKALSDYSNAIKIKPDYAHAYQNRASVFHELKQLDKAITDLDEAIRVNPAYARAYHNRCYARTLLGRDLSKALADCNKALELNTKSTNTFEARGLVYYLLGRYEDALRDADTSYKRSRRADSLYLRGLARQKIGQITEGKIDIEAALKVDPGLVEKMTAIGVK